MKPADVSDEDWEEALFIEPHPPDTGGVRISEPVHVFLQRRVRVPHIYLLENGCLVRGKYMYTDDYGVGKYIESNKDRYLGIGYLHSM
jgi:hypothetical protein